MLREASPVEMSPSNAVPLLFTLALIFELGLFGLWVNALIQQPKRLKARMGFWGNLLFLAFEVLLFVSRRDAQMTPLLLPMALLVPVLASFPLYRLYRRWDAKYWDPTAPDFLGWNQP